MWYTHRHIPVMNPEEWYNRLGNAYQEYHTKLSARDRSSIEKYLPRKLQGLAVLDLWGGDGRRARSLSNEKIGRWTILDISTNLLSLAPWRTERVHTDLLIPFPLEAQSYDLIICTFVLSHLSRLDDFATEARRVIRPWGRMLIFHYYERRPRVHMVDNKPYKIQTRHRPFDVVHHHLVDAWWDVDVFPVDEMSKLYCCFPCSS